MKREFNGKLKMIGAILIFIIFLPILAEASITNCGNVQEIIVEGLSSIQPQEDIANARNRAIADALRHAVERVLGLYIEEETLMEDFSKLEIAVYKESKGHVVTYEIIKGSEKKEEGIYSLRIKATICLEPRILVIIPEKYKGKEISDHSAETAIIDGLLKAHFSVISKQERNTIYKNPLIKKVLAGDKKATLKLAMYYGANVVIIGKASSEKTGMVSDFHSVLAYLEIRVHKTDEDKIIAAHSLQISGAGINENSAIKMAFNLAGEQMADYLIERLAQYRNPEEIKIIHLFIDNLKSEYQFDKLKELIGKMLLVVEVKVNFIENDKAELIIKSLGDIAGLTENLNNLSLMDLDIRRTEEDTLHVTLR